MARRSDTRRMRNRRWANGACRRRRAGSRGLGSADGDDRCRGDCRALAAGSREPVGHILAPRGCTALPERARGARTLRRSRWIRCAPRPDSSRPRRRNRRNRPGTAVRRSRTGSGGRPLRCRQRRRLPTRRRAPGDFPCAPQRAPEWGSAGCGRASDDRTGRRGHCRTDRPGTRELRWLRRIRRWAWSARAARRPGESSWPRRARSNRRRRWSRRAGLSC